MMVEINICRLRPPELPKFRSPPTDSEQKMINIRDSSTSYQDYIKICGGGDSDGISPPFTESLSYSSNDWIAGPVVVAIIVFFLLVILALFLIKKYKGRKFLYQNILCYIYKAPPTRRDRKESLSSVESKKSGSISCSLGEIQQNGKHVPVVFTNQVTVEEIDFKHSSTAQLIDETMILEQNSNTIEDSSDWDKSAYEQGSTQNNTPDKQIKTVQPDLDDSAYEQTKTSDIQRDNNDTEKEKSNTNPPKKERKEMQSESGDI
ncbi:uncharacterized protein LOC125652380 isoform X7 [Ostrea edulis]|uniref:uncharacterized protein LOC125652380 isoform X7 n=1 Tax=Ostrea edulis TaxID=37623 RepID=UPI0024AEFCED|nr:uncharacterized protein LOC125652380 isoform X7 [Ostrea edulis]XP_056021018.1 uncharacterized protein LOC125652380 isoform X7 [Ostrea edulis]